MWGGKGLEDAAQKRVLDSLLPRGGRCLELGSGFGRITETLLSRFEPVVALDSSRRNLSLAKDRLPGASWERADISEIPCVDSVFDCIVMVRVIHLLTNPNLVMSEIQRVAKDGATVVITIPNLAMNTLLWRAKGRLLPSGLKHRTPTFGHAVWPFGTSPYFITPRHIAPGTFTLVARRGTGLFDNAAGRALERFRGLCLVDVATSPIWWLKLDIFLKFSVRK